MPYARGLATQARWRVLALAFGGVASLLLMGVLGSHWLRTTRMPTAQAPARSAVEKRDGNVAWLVNAQDCEWAAADLDMPRAGYAAGKLLRLRGLAEIESTGVRG